MVTVRIIGTDQELEAKDATITYVKVAGDLGEITAVNSSYSWSLKFPKTNKNTQVLDGLGLVGSSSRKPYEKVYVTLLEHGMPIVDKGLLNVTETNDNYQIFINEGTIDFLRDLKEATIGQQIDLFQLDHERTVEYIEQSNVGDKEIVYALADVNGKYLQNTNTVVNFDSDFMIPYIKYKFIWDKIFNKYGWTYTMPPDVEASLAGTYMSYPNELVRQDNGTSSILVFKGLNGGEIKQFPNRFTGNMIVFGLVATDYILTDYITDSGVNDLRRFKAERYGTFRIELATYATMEVRDVHGNNFFYSRSIPWRIATTGGYLTDYIPGTPGNASVDIQRELILNETFWIEYDIEEALRQEGRFDKQDISVRFIQNSLDMRVNFITGGTTNLSKALINLKMKDFIKEFMVRESLTAFTNNTTKNIDFLTLDQRLSATSLDWSDKFSKRKSETYLYRNYAQNNFLRHKYQEQGFDFNDGKLEVTNENLEDDKTIYTSYGYSADDQLVEVNAIVGGTEQPVYLPKLPIYRAEVTEDKDNGGLVATYTFQKDRYMIVKLEDKPVQVYIDGLLTDMSKVADFYSASFANIVNIRYNNFPFLGYSSKVHQIEMDLSLSDIIALDLKKKYYFEQEAGHYILNQLTYKSGTLTTGEFIRINNSSEVMQNIDPIPEPQVTIQQPKEAMGMDKHFPQPVIKVDVPVSTPVHNTSNTTFTKPVEKAPELVKPADTITHEDIIDVSKPAEDAPEVKPVEPEPVKEAPKPQPKPQPKPEPKPEPKPVVKPVAPEPKPIEQPKPTAPIIKEVPLPPPPPDITRIVPKWIPDAPIAPGGTYTGGLSFDEDDQGPQLP